MFGLRRYPLVHLAILGDSLARGEGASSGDSSLSGHIERRLAQRAAGHSVTNLSVSGATLRHVSYLQVRHVPVEANVILLMAGANDVPTLKDAHAFAARYAVLLGRIRARVPSARLIVTGMPNIALTPYVAETQKPMVASICRSLNEVMRFTAANYQATFIDLFWITNRARRNVARYLASDGYHPSDEGYALIARGLLTLLIP